MKDAKRFILEFRYIVALAPLQLYDSALIFSPKTSVIKCSFSDQMPRWIENLPKVENNWSPSLQTLEGHLRQINSIVFSPDGQIMASGSDDCNIRLWDPVTGGIRATLKGHSGSVCRVVFSPDGQLLASGSSDGTVRLWDPATGDSRGTLISHFAPISEIFFTPDGQLLASMDSTVGLWDPITGELRDMFRGPFDRYNGIAFLPDGQLLGRWPLDPVIAPSGFGTWSQETCGVRLRVIWIRFTR